MENLKIGVVSGVHGLKGEIKIKSDSKYKNQIFYLDNLLYLGIEKKSYIIKSYRVHKEYDMVTFEGINNIDEALKFKNKDVYIDKNKLILPENEYLNEDLIGINVWFENKELGIINDIADFGQGNEIMEIIGQKRVLIPKNKQFIAEIDIKLRQMTLKNVKGMI